MHGLVKCGIFLFLIVRGVPCSDGAHVDAVSQRLAIVKLSMLGDVDPEAVNLIAGCIPRAMRRFISTSRGCVQ